jgi:outer membrane protein assembly factor BamB
MRHLTLHLLLLTASTALAQSQWPEFRGPTAQGHSTATGLPESWSPTQGIAWRTELPGTAWSSPIVAEGKIYLTNAIPAGGETRLTLLALDAATGKQAWETQLFLLTDPEAQKMHKKNSHASPTPIYEEGHIYAHFSHHGTACVKTDGTLQWKSTENPYTPVHGTGGSPVIAGDHLIYNADGAENPSVIALNKKTGTTAWKTPRTGSTASRTFSFSTPLLIEVKGQQQVITVGSTIVQALSPSDGRVLWHAKFDQGYSVVPRPLYAHGNIYLSTGYDRPAALAIRADGSGDVTSTHILWKADKRIPHNPSMLILDKDLYMIDDKGIITCRDALTGTVYYEERLLSNTSASLLYADGRIYAIDEQGQAKTLKPGHTLQVLATSNLAERTLASMAVVDSDLLIRTEKAVYRIKK